MNELGKKNNPDDTTLYSQLFGELKNKKLLQRTELLHDIGKGESGADHSQRGAELSNSILSRCGYSDDEISSVSFLIREHLLLKEIATHRDLNDEQTAISCAEVINDVERLKMLYLLTVADCMSTGSKAWTDWTDVLVRDLFFRVLGVLKNGELGTKQSAEIIKNKKETILSSP